MRAVLSLALIATAIAGDVVQLTPDNFDAVLSDKTKTLTLVKFYAPWCGHCKSMAADYESAATELKASDPNIVLAELDADAHSSYASKFGVQGFPTLKIFRDGDLKKPEDYNGPRDLKGIVKAVQKAARPLVTAVADEAALAEAVKNAAAEGELAIGAVVTADSKDTETLTKFAKKARAFTVYTTVGAKRSIKLYLKGDEPVEFTEGKLTVAKLNTWAEANRFPLYAEINQDNYKNYMDRGVPLAWVFTDPEADHHKAIEAPVLAAAAATKGKVSFVHLSGTQYSGMAERVGISGKEWPAIAVDDSGKKKHYVFPKQGAVPDADELTAWVNDVLGGKIASTVRSEAEPETQPADDGVFVLTGKNFEEATLKSGKDVMIEFYAPWCGHCKSLAPEYSAVARALAKSDGVRIAKMDATANDVPVEGFEVSGFPTLYFVTAAGKITQYSGGRTKADILAYVQEHATKEVTVDED